MRMEGNPQKHSDYFTVGDVEEMQVFGHLDFLFRDEESQFMADLNDMILDYHKAKKNRGPNGEPLTPAEQSAPQSAVETLTHLEVPQSPLVTPSWSPYTQSRDAGPFSPTGGLTPTGVRTPNGVRTPASTRPTTGNAVERAAIEAVSTYVTALYFLPLEMMHSG